MTYDRKFNPLKLAGRDPSKYKDSPVLKSDEGRFATKSKSTRRMVILIFPAKATSADLAKVLQAIPAGTIVTGTHYNSEKSQYGLLLSHWSFDPVNIGNKIPECIAIVDTTGVQFEVIDVDTGYFEPARWQYIDARSWARKMFDYFFN